MQNIFHKWQNVVSYYQDGSQSKICTVDNRAGSEGMKRTWVSTLCHLPHEWSLTGEGSQSFDDWVTIQGASVRKEGKTCDLDVGFVIGLIMAFNYKFLDHQFQRVAVKEDHPTRKGWSICHTASFLGGVNQWNGVGGELVGRYNWFFADVTLFLQDNDCQLK